MRILIVDDNAENLTAAKQAAENFSEHQFSFTNSAKEAAKMLSEADALITDLFFPDENLGDGGDLDWFYALYRTEMADNLAFAEVVRNYYDGDESKASENLYAATALLEDGTIRGAIEGLINSIEQRSWQFPKGYTDKYRERLQNLPVPQFAYGGALMIQAKELSKRHCLVSDIHRHAGEFKDAPGAVDGMVLLLPIMGRGIASVEQVKYDGRSSLTYLGSDEVRKAGKGKTDPAVWTEAIHRVLAQ